jgi:hypothetical protein
MRKIILFISFLIASTLSAQINVLPYANAPTAEGIIYALPKTVLVIEVEAVKTIQKAGPYFQYSQRYLGTTEVISENKESWEITSIRLRTKTIADTAKSYKIIADGKAQIPSIVLNKKGIICSVNVPQEKQGKQQPAPTPKMENAPASLPKVSFTNNAFTEDLALANSTAKIAEGIAKQIYRIRENRLSLITADVDHMPADGKSLELMLKNMNKTEQELMELFVGKTIKTSVKKVVEFIPEDNAQNIVIFRFSALNGLLPANDLSGSPLYLNIAAEKKELKLPELSKKNPAYGLFYNIPGSAQLEITDGKKVFVEQEEVIAQFGSVQTLPVSLFSNKDIKIKFNTRTGAIESIEK